MAFRTATRFGLGFGLVAAAIVACSGDRDPFDGPDQSRFQETDSGDFEPDAGCGLRCSRDLKSILSGCEGDETVVQTCGPDQGCGVRSCVDSCEAARISKGSVGCEFWTLPVDSGKESKGACFAAMVSNTWDRPVTIAADYGRMPLDISRSIYTVAGAGESLTYIPLDGPLPQGQVAIVFLSQAANTADFDGVACPKSVVPAVQEDPIRQGSARTNAFRITTDAPVAAYSIFPYGGATSYLPTATLLLPASSWENDYLAVSPFEFEDLGASTLQIVAREDDTVVSIRPNVEVQPGYDLEGATAGFTHTWRMARGEVLQFTQRSMTGSPISSTKPVGVFGGSRCTNIPSDNPACDVLQQQISPISQWGTAYALVPYPSRSTKPHEVVRERVPYTVVSVADGTELTYEPSRPAGAPERLDAGQMATFTTDELLVGRCQDSKHPFYAAVYMTGQGWLNSSFLRGDPEFVNLSPIDQFLDHYVFFTDHTYAETRLTVVRRKTANGFLPVELECAGEVENFHPLGVGGELEYAWVSLTTGFTPGKFPKGECGYGRHKAWSEGPFSITVWGLGSYSSYGYLAGTGLRPINDAPLPSLN